MTLHEAADAASALAWFENREAEPALVLLDVNLPGIDGLEILRRIRAAGVGCPVVVLSSMVTRQVVEEAIDAGADAYLRKDLPKTEIEERLRAVMAATAAPPRAVNQPG